MTKPPVRSRIRDQHVRSAVPLPTPRELQLELAVDETAAHHIARAREQIQAILHGSDARLLVVVGPCSVDHTGAALEFADRLAALSAEVDDVFMLAMRVYFEKPRTTIGWKGLINDPDLDGTGDLPKGLGLARSLLLTLAQRGVPTATEFLEPVIPQYLADLVCWASIGARTTESPTHRQMASGLSMPVGFKNGTDGSLDTAVNAMVAAAVPHHFLGIDPDGRVAIIETTGNPDRHLILRGGSAGVNYGADAVGAATAALRARELPPRLLVDCSHGNSGKDPGRQARVVDDLLCQIDGGESAILGFMLESYLSGGRQDIPREPEDRRYGVSLTDACLGWEDTAALLRNAAARVRDADG